VPFLWDGGSSLEIIGIPVVRSDELESFGGGALLRAVGL
jgi:hypothetical protein